MKLKPIITSLLENDAYKFSMGNVIFKKFNNFTTNWTFKCRNTDVIFTDEMIQEIKDQFDYYCTLRFTDEELNWLKTNMSWISEGYINFLKFWHPVRSDVSINENGIKPVNKCGLAIEANGTWLNTSMYEIALLAIVNEVYFSFQYDMKKLEISFKTKLEDKINDLVNMNVCIGKFSEFGLRRRLSGKTQDYLINELKNAQAKTNIGFVGTSNVYLAKKYGVKAVGTMAHEMGMAMMSDQRYNVAYTNERLMEVWTNEYGIKNGIYLTDLLGRDVFLEDFNEKYATLFSGVRHDSGCPFAWGDAIIKHYEKLGIDPKTKTLLFSDSLNFEKAQEIYDEFEGRCNVAFGIGTFLSNDTFAKPLNIVMKITDCNGLPVCKLTDNPEKAMGKDEEFINFVKRAIMWRLS
jgi:nicotinate phosphoribosyltransferase